jgi:hypothetical protein
MGEVEELELENLICRAPQHLRRPTRAGLCTYLVDRMGVVNTQKSKMFLFRRSLRKQPYLGFEVQLLGFWKYLEQFAALKPYGSECFPTAIR